MGAIMNEGGVDKKVPFPGFRVAVEVLGVAACSSAVEAFQRCWESCRGS